MKYAFAILICLLCFEQGYSQATTTRNYVMINTVKQTGVTTEAGVNALAIATQAKGQTIQYIDGLGRPLQTVVTQGSASQKDIVTGTEYDQYGREIKKYLPYADQGSTAYGSYKDRWTLNQANFYNATMPNVDADNYPFSQSILESSPSSRLLAQGAPGFDWQPNLTNAYDPLSHVMQMSYLVNKLEDNVRMFSVDPAGNITSSGYYPSGQLTEKVTTDEQGQVVKEFADKSNHVVVKRVIIAADSLQTYYLYDNMDMLRAVIQPEGVSQLQAASWAFPAGFAAKWMFLYRYDSRKRMVMKEVPGADSVNMIYDQWDRVVLTQDANLRTAHNFIFTKYDQLNRLVVTGQITDSRALTAVTADVAAATGRYETVSTSATEGYTLNGSFPLSTSYTLTVYTITHYDSYANLPSWSSGYSFVNEYGVSTQNNLLSGLVVATQVRILGASTFNRTVNYYDDKYRVIQTTSDNAAGGKDRITKILSFDGKVTSDYHAHTSRFYTTALPITQTYTYDHVDRLLNVTHQTGTQEVVTIAQNAYNELGQPLNKKLHQSTSHPNSLQKIDYYYNIRGWLNSINRPVSTQTGYEESDLFNEELHYEKNMSMAGAAPQYNGNIGEEVWKGGYDEYYRAYKLSYDQANRFTDAVYGYISTGTGWVLTLRYDESGITYDHNGNIQTLQRMHGNWTKVDDLHYLSYNGNRLGDVIDYTPAGSPVGFQDASHAPLFDYNYDVNGNLISDYNKAISSITYNYLNLPQVVTMTGKGTITYTYDAAGNKLQKSIYNQNTTKTTNYFYAGDFVYRNGGTTDTLEFISHPEGRLRPVKIDTTQALTTTNLKYVYDYYIKDHLGSVRDVLTTEQQTDHYFATMEAATAAKEDALFSNVSSTSTTVLPGFTNDASNKKFSKLNGEINTTGNKRIGPSIILKVMAGDTISVSTLCWYSGNVQAPPSDVTAPIATDILSLLTTGITAGGGTKGGTIPTTVSGPLLAQAVTNFLNVNQNYDPLKPKAFLNWMVVDEEFAGVSSTNHLGAKQVPIFNATDTNKQLLGLNRLVIRRNGWIYVYLSNESNQDVFFDNLAVTLTHGPLVEEKDYYPFGLEIPGLSTHAIKQSYYDNRYRYNGMELQTKEFNDTTGLEDYDYGARMYDPQIARWKSIDQMTEKFTTASAYEYANDNPINAIDIAGKFAVSVHYEITFGELIKLGYSQKQADLIAHYASTYSDHPTNAALSADAWTQTGGMSTWSPYGYRQGIDYTKTAQSQDEKNSKWHSMMSDQEAENGMTEQQAMDRGLQFGWDNIFAFASSTNGQNINDLGQGIHALQDAIAHRGVRTSDHLGLNWSSFKKLANDSYGSRIEAANLTRSALIVVDVLKGNKNNLKSGDTLDLQGMSSTQLQQFMQRLLKLGFYGSVYNTNN